MLDQNPWPLLLATPVLALLLFYSYTKRFTRWSHVVLGLGIAFAPVAAWIAIRPASLGAVAWCLMAAVTFWIAGFDLIYACQDVAFDRENNLHSVPARMGIPAALALARVFHVFTAVLLVVVGFLANLGWLYFVGVGLAIALLLIENAIVRPNDLSRVNLAFFTLNGAVGLMLGILGVCDILMT
ncbi:MAG: UbiA family prenyltransferase [Phycisphaerae bacterium]